MSGPTTSPALPWRGVMLDVARHFLPVVDVRRMIDAMALLRRECNVKQA